MKILRKPIIEFISHVLVLIVISAIFAFNEQKGVVYPIKVFFVLYMLCRFVVYRGRFSKYTLWGLVFITICFASSLWALDQEKSLYSFAWVLQVLLISIFMESFINDNIKLEYVLKCFITGGLLLAMRLLIETPVDVWGLKRIGTAIGYNANDVGLKLAFASLCSTYFIKNGNRKWVFVLITCSLVTIAMLSGSKKALLVVVGGIIMYYLFSLKKSNRIILALPSVAIFLVGIYFAVLNVDALYNVLGYRIELMFATFAGEGSSGSTAVRMYMVNTAWELFSSKPILGHGVGNFSVVSGLDTYSHNNYLEILSNLGIVGFMAYYSLYLYLFINLLKELKKGNPKIAFPLMILLVILTIESGLVSYNTGYIQILLMFCFSYLRVERRYERTNLSKEKNLMKIKRRT